MEFLPPFLEKQFSESGKERLSQKTLTAMMVGFNHAVACFKKHFLMALHTSVWSC